MNLFKLLGIRQRYAFGFTIVITGVMLIFSGVVIIYNSKSIERELRIQLEKIASFSKESLSIALWQFNHDYVNEYINSLFHYEALVFAGVVVDEKIIARKARMKYQNDSFERLRESPDFLSTEVVVVYKQQALGKVQLVMSRERINHLTLVSSAIAILLLFVVNVAVFTTNYILSRWYLFEPLSKLESTVSSIANGDLDASIDIKRQDEIGHLAASVKKMMVNLKKITTSRNNLNREVRERKKFENELKYSLKEKEVLLKEIHHRVKNNMQIVQSLLNLQARKIGDAELIQVIQDSINRINSMALIHETLYRSEDLAHLNIEIYFNNLVRELYRVYNEPEKTIDWTVNVDGIILDLDKSIACGLIINELVSNSMKHAFVSSAKGYIRISLSQPCAGKAELIVSDDGIGLPHGFDVDSNATLGLRIVLMLARDQLEGTLDIKRDHGLNFKLTFPT